MPAILQVPIRKSNINLQIFGRSTFSVGLYPNYLLSPDKVSWAIVLTETENPGDSMHFVRVEQNASKPDGSLRDSADVGPTLRAFVRKCNSLFDTIDPREEVPMTSEQEFLDAIARLFIENDRILYKPIGISDE